MLSGVISFLKHLPIRANLIAFASRSHNVAINFNFNRSLSIDSEQDREITKLSIDSDLHTKD